LADAVASASDDRVLDVGVEWTLRQAEDLLARGVPALHFFVVHGAGPIKRLMERLKI
jgi:methylenetetrahydrofolate reductase (NADPH)